MSFSDGRQDILFSIKAEPQGVAGPGQGKCVLGEALPGKAEECQTRGGRRSRGKLRAWRSGRRPGRGESGLGRTGAPAQLEEGAGGQAEADLLGRGPEVSQRGPLRRRGSGGRPVLRGGLTARGKCLELRTSVTARGLEEQKGRRSPGGTGSTSTPLPSPTGGTPPEYTHAHPPQARAAPHSPQLSP